MFLYIRIYFGSVIDVAFTDWSDPMVGFVSKKSENTRVLLSSEPDAPAFSGSVLDNTRVRISPFVQQTIDTFFTGIYVFRASENKCHAGGRAVYYTHVCCGALGNSNVLVPEYLTPQNKRFTRLHLCTRNARWTLIQRSLPEPSVV